MVDWRLKQAPHSGFVPRGADVVFSADDLPAVWDTFLDSPAFGRVIDNAPQAPQRFGVWLRRETGVRWTPGRWNTWFGAPVIAGRTPDGVGLCARPGLAARIVLGLARLTGRVSSGDDISELNGIHFAWRDGYLLAGNSAGVVRSFLVSNQSKPLSGEQQTVSLAWANTPKGHVSAHFDPAIRFEGHVAIQAESPPAPRMLVEEWPQPALFAIAGSGGDAWFDVTRDLWPEFPGSELIERVLEEFADRLPADWNAATDSVAFALFSVDSSQLVAVPETALIVRGRSPLAPLNRPRSAIPYQWSGVDGWMEPWLGERAAVYAAAGDRFRMFTNQEPTMAALLSRSQIGRITASDVTLRCDVQELGEVATAMIRNAADHELLPRRNRDDADRDLVPVAEAVSQLGVLWVEGKYDDHGLAFEGRFGWKEMDGGT